MDNSNLINALFTVQEALPGMRWYTEDGVLKMEVWITPENEEFLAAGREMFRADDLF